MVDALDQNVNKLSLNQNVNNFSLDQNINNFFYSKYQYVSNGL